MDLIHLINPYIAVSELSPGPRTTLRGLDCWESLQVALPACTPQANSCNQARGELLMRHSPTLRGLVLCIVILSSSELMY